MEQVIRIVCVSQSAHCSHLFSHNGPEGKLVRMPERVSCPFPMTVQRRTCSANSAAGILLRVLRKPGSLTTNLYPEDWPLNCGK